MPIVQRHRGLMPANARASDTAARMVEHLAPMQQQKSVAAFRVQGIEGYLFNHLTQGRPCTCKSSEKQINSILGPDGKAPHGVISDLISGREFGVAPYSQGNKIDPFEDGKFLDPNKFVDFDVMGNDPETHNRTGESEGVGANGAFNDSDIDDIIKNFDTSEFGYSDVSCPICFGSGFVGGYSPYRGWRHVITPADVAADEYIDMAQAPWVLHPCTFRATVTLPLGAIAVDSLRVFNNNHVVAARISVDNTVISTAPEFLLKCDGLKHILTVTVEEPVTHMEIQLATAETSSFFEFPRLSKSSDISLLDSTDPFQILVSPDVPLISSLDVIVESQQGKALLVQSVSPFQTRKRNSLGWECNVRMCQPTELFCLLPSRGRISRQPVTNKVHPVIIK
jgi:hypothetical protein